MHAAGKEVNSLDKCKLKLEGLWEALRFVPAFSVLATIATSGTNVDTSISYGGKAKSKA